MRDSTNSLLWSELVYSASDLLKFINDRAYEQAFKSAESIQYENIEHLLAFLDSAEIFLEVGCFLVGGPTAKWIAISTVQVLKSTWRVIYVVKKKKMIIRPILGFTDRNSLQNSHKKTFLSRSGRSIRSIEDPEFSESTRVWKPDIPKYQTKLKKQQIIAELAYILQPLIHLSSLGFFGLNSWKPWLLSTFCDLLSQALHYDKISDLSPVEKRELWRRRHAMFLYFLRSPLYDLYTKKLFLTLFVMTKPKIPFSSHISDFLIAYIPHYRRIYSHLWSK